MEIGKMRKGDVIIEQFFNIFWNNKGCRALFLLHKTELLEHKSVEYEEQEKNIFRPRIIISNSYEKQESNLNLTLKASNFVQKMEHSFEIKANILEPKIEAFVKKKFQKSINKLETDFSSKTKSITLGFKVAKFLANPEKNENVAIKLLQDYGFIGKHITSFKELGESLEKSIRKNFKKLLSEENVFHFFDTIELGRFFYYSIMYKSLLDSNKVLVDSLHDSEDYQDRIEVLTLLQDEGLLRSGTSETYFRCLNCQPGTAFGSAILNVRIKNMIRFTCPTCSEPFFYLSPIHVHPRLFKMITGKDGLLIFAVQNFLLSKGYNVESNVHLGADIEVDVEAKNQEGFNLFVETKMFEVHENERNQHRKIRKAVKETKEQIEKIAGTDGLQLPDQYCIVTNLDSLKLITDAVDSKELQKLGVPISVHTLDSFTIKLAE